MKGEKQFRWSEVRDDGDQGQLELYYVLAEQDATGWTFYEQSSWELRWYQIPETEDLVKKAVTEMGRQMQLQQRPPKLKKSASVPGSAGASD